MGCYFCGGSACNANTQISARILILAEVNLREATSVSIEGWGRSPFDVKWLRDGTNRAKKKRQEMRVPSLPSKESKAEWHSSQNLSVTLLQRVSLGNDWAFVKTHK